MARRSQCSSAGDNPLDPNYLPPHYREEYRLAIDALVEKDLDGYYDFLQKADVVDFLAGTEIHYIQNSVQTPNQSSQPEQYFVESDGDGSSDTYWPVHSDLEVPGLDLGWPHTHSFIEPTEITTLVNPPEPDMPSIKDQARRLIKNAQQVIAVVMDIFTDVDMFADILNAASRRVAVYILLDEHNAHHFVNMVVNCRVNLQNFQFLRVRTVSGITYQCRSGKTFKGQMMDRFLLTDCRAVLSGNYSFMWSFEKLHRCMAHLFLGQLVTNFDEEFRILFAQSQPLIIENVLAPMEDLNVLHKSQYPVESSLMYREPRKFLSPDSGHPDEWARHSFEERMDGDWRLMALKKQDPLRGPGDMYNRFASQQPRMEPSFDQGPSRILMTENPALKRHSFAEGLQNRYSFPFMQQQGMPESEPKGKPVYRGQQPYPGPGPEADYSAYDKFWNKDYLPPEQHFEPGLPQEVPPPDNFDPVLNYFSSTRNPDFDQGSDKFLPASHPKRLNLSQPYVCQTSPTPSSSADQKQVFQQPTTNRKDPTVKQGLRNWRISSFLSAYENPEDEGLPLEPSQSADAFEDPPYPIQQTAPGTGLLVPKIPNVKEFKVPAAPRASQIPNYAKATIQEKPKKLPEEPVPVAVELKITPAPSDISTNEGEKTEEAEQREPKSSVLRREDSFRRKYNTAMQRSSRLRSSLIYHSLDQQPTPQETTSSEQQDEDSDKDKTEQIKLPFVSHVLGQRKPATREPFEWSRYIKSPSETRRSDDISDKDSSKEDNSKALLENVATKDVEQDTPSASTPQPELSKTDQLSQSAKSLLTSSLYEDMSDHDKRFLFFKELAAKRKAEAEKENEKAKTKQEADLKTSSTIQNEELLPKMTSGNRKSSISEGLIVKSPAAEGAGRMVSTGARESASFFLDESENANKKDSVAKNVSETFSEKETKFSAGLEKPKLNIQSAAGLSGSAETGEGHTKSPVEPAESSLFRKDFLTSSRPRSKPAEAELAKTDRPVQPAKPLITYMDMNDPDNRLMFFRELAAQRKAEEAKKEKERVQIKPQVELKNSSTPQKEEPPLKVTSEGIKTSTPEGLAVSAAEENVEKTTEARESASLLLDNKEKTSLKDSVVNKDSKTCSEQEAKLPVFAKTDSCFSKSPEAPAVLNPFVGEGSNVPPHKHDSPADVSSVTDEREKLALEHTSKEFVSVTPSSVEPTPSPALVTNTQNVESARLESSIYSPPSEPDAGSEISSHKSLSSDHSLPVSGSQNSPLIAEDASSSSRSPDVPNTSPQRDDEAKALERVNTPSQEASPSASETLQKSDDLNNQTDHLDSVPQSVLSENLPAADSANVEPGICPAPEPNVFYSTTNCEERSAAAPSAEGSEKADSQLEKGESVVEESKSDGASEDTKVDSKSPTVSPSVPESSQGVSDLESPVSKHDLKDTNTPSKQTALEAESVENTDFYPVSSPSGTATTPQNIPTQTLLSTSPNRPTPAGAELSSSLSEPDHSVLTPETKKTEIVSTTDRIVSISSDPQPKEEESPAHQSTESLSSSSEVASETPAEADLPCKTSETEQTSKSQTEPTAPEEINEKEPEVVDTDKKSSDNPEDTCKSENVGTQESVTSENSKNRSESAEITSKQPKSAPSRYHSSTANVLSSSNLRDDTKLLLEQISANCQSRNEATKESPVTDDEKEDKADKKAKKEKGFRTLIGGQPKPPQEREKLLERIQSMRKEKKIYSRFEMSS